jgi:dolichol-phosphate mannosyltransferase
MPTDLTGKNTKLDFSLILTTYNEPHIVGPDVDEIIKFLDKLRYNYEIILVDDLGPKNAREVIKGLIKKYEKDHNISCILNETNQGRGRSVELGFAKAKGEIVGYIDIDLEVSHYFIPQLIDAIKEEGFDGATGRRMDIFGIRSLHRWFATKVYITLVHVMTGTNYMDTETGYKFFKKSAYDKIASIPKDNGWFWDTEIMFYASKHGLKIKEVPVIYIQRPDKTSTVRLVHDSIQQFKKLLTLKPKG